MHVTDARVATAYHLARLACCAALTYTFVCSLWFEYGGLPRHRAETAWFITAALAVLALGWGCLRAKRDAETVRERDARENPWPLLALFLAGSFLLYGPSLRLGLLSDDFVLLARAAAGDLRVGNEFFRPLPFYIWRLSSEVAPRQAELLHALNVTGHGLNGWLVYLIACQFCIARHWAVLGGAFFMTTVCSVEPVVWLSGLFDVAMTAGVLMFILACVRGSSVLAFLALPVALLSKETGMVAPVLGAMAAASISRSLRIPIIGLVVTASYIALRLLLLPPPETYYAFPSRYLLKELVSRSFGTLGVPWTSRDVADQPVVTLFSLLAITCALATALAFGITRRRFSLAVISASWVGVSVLPVYSYFFVSPTLEGSRYVYLGTAAFALLLIALASSPQARSRIGGLNLAVLVMTTACGAFGVRLHQQQWRSAAALREVVLTAAARTFPVIDCASMSVVGLPDSQDGAYVFRNGFSDALAKRGIDAPPIQEQNAACSFQWNGREFTRSGP